MTHHIVCATDANCVPPFAALLQSLKLSNRELDFVVHLLHAELPRDMRSRLADFADRIAIDLRWTPVDAPRLYELERRFLERSPKHLAAPAFFRCLIGELLPETINRVLYLDTDVINLRPLAPLLELDLQGKTAAAGRSTATGHLDMFGLVDADYFNSGVMLIDLNTWRRDDIGQRTIEFLFEHVERCRSWDQCALNVVLKDLVLPLGPEWNYFESLMQDVPLIHPAIVHYVGPNKPWDDPTQQAFGAYYCNASQSTPWPTDYRLRKPPKTASKIRRRINKVGRALANF